VKRTNQVVSSSFGESNLRSRQQGKTNFHVKYQRDFLEMKMITHMFVQAERGKSFGSREVQFRSKEKMLLRCLNPKPGTLIQVRNLGLRSILKSQDT